MLKIEVIPERLEWLELFERLEPSLPELLPGNDFVVLARLVRARIPRQINLAEHLVRRLSLLGKIVGGHGLSGVEDEFGFHGSLFQEVIAVGGGIQMRADDVGNDYQVAVRLKSHRQCP